MRCAAKASENAAMRLRSAAADEARAVNASGDNFVLLFLVQAHAVMHRMASKDYDLELIYSGESDGDTDSTKAATKTEPSKSVSRSAVSLAERRDIIESSDESDAPSSRRSRSLESIKAVARTSQTMMTMTQ